MLNVPCLRLVLRARWVAARRFRRASSFSMDWTFCPIVASRMQTLCIAVSSRSSCDSLIRCSFFSTGPIVFRLGYDSLAAFSNCRCFESKEAWVFKGPCFWILPTTFLLTTLNFF